MPQIGDMLCVRSKHRDGRLCVGLVEKIILDSYGHQKHVFVFWSDNVEPPFTEPYVGYRSDYGYNGTNIHNWRGFTIVRDGKIIR